MTSYRVPKAYGEAAFTERRSVFTGRVFPVKTEREALAQLRALREAYPDASHHVYAYILREEGLMRYSDDGEPHGTAGMPVLEVFRREELFDFLCVVTRYFGGILLGAGGLIRAYAKGAKAALDAAGTALLRPVTMGMLCCPYPLWDTLRAELHNAGVVWEDIAYGADVTAAFLIPEEQWTVCAARAVEVSAGQVVPEAIEVHMRPF